MVQHQAPRSVSSQMCLPDMPSKQDCQKLALHGSLLTTSQKLGRDCYCRAKGIVFHHQERKYVWTDKVQVSLVKSCFSSQSFCLSENKEPPHGLESNHLLQKSSNQSNWFFWYAAHSEIVQPVPSQTWVAQRALHAVHLSNTSEVL